MRRQATLTVGSALLCGLDVLLAPVLVLITAVVSMEPDPSAAVRTAHAGVAACAAASVVCPIAALAAGLLGAPRRLVQWLALLPIGALGVLIVVVIVSEVAQR